MQQEHRRSTCQRCGAINVGLHTNCLRCQSPLPLGIDEGTIQPRREDGPVVPAQPNKPAAPAFCTKCGATLQPGKRFCTKCGRQTAV